MSEKAIEFHDFYGRAFVNAYTKFVNALQMYSEKYKLKFDYDTNMTKDNICLNVYMISFMFSKIEKDEICEFLNSEKEVLIGINKINITPIWEKVDKKERKKILIFLNLLKDTSQKITENAFSEISSFQDTDCSTPLTIEDMNKNVENIDKLTEETNKEGLPNLSFFRSIINSFLLKIGVDNTNIKDVLLAFKSSIKEKKFKKNFNKILSDTLGKNQYAKTLEPIFNKLTDEMAKNIDSFDLSKIEGSDVSSSLLDMANKLVPNASKYASEITSNPELSNPKNISKLMSSLMSQINGMPSGLNKVLSDTKKIIKK